MNEIESINNKIFVLGDIHGAHKALIQCLERSQFDYDNDTLIVLGDVVDEWPETPQCIEELLKINNLIYIMGNHDAWADKWLRFAQRELNWIMQGGQVTIDAYIKNGDLLIKHRDFFAAKPYKYIDDKNRLFVHGGIIKGIGINRHYVGDLMWDRSLVQRALQKDFKRDRRFSEIYIGHTSIWKYSHEPLIKGNVIMLDTGAGYDGKLSIMNAETKESWQSDLVEDLYPEESGKN